ncbi:hypothetical protein H8356DRAFT_1332687 [Neocallimastix lanati (nom. inval.)]|uniref:Uncharacterized protein n=1 Tax=Neocallimastix californiae TaxID=1754190 RepID=A0A1Y2F4G5_9FUNG|nr:hypothetical protein H8356DRAFT_1332687 [Neocallimastix sp. JGI-2020a]ORY78761.1 hypothetical protein LY90DRAFT_698273 [Neocallimastix californiae]|eukprot:ORY78761.1 hypothetical protein LY90DRAFT_698273 [Neocallimastix californiae]
MKANNLILFFSFGLFFLATSGKLVRRNLNIEELDDFGKNFKIGKGRIMPPGIDIDIDNLEEKIKENEEKATKKEKEEKK